MKIQNLNQIPMVIESSGRGERAYDIYSRLLKEPMQTISLDTNNKPYINLSTFILIIL